MAKDDDDLADAKEAFRLAADAETENREDARADLTFARLGEQWDEKIVAKRRREGRPCLTINRMPAFIRQVVNDVRQNRPQIKVRPVDGGADLKTAEVMSGLIRNIEYSSNAEVAYDTAADYAVSMGFGYFRIAVEYAYADTFERDLKIQRIANPFSVYGDPHSQEADSSDWNSGFVTELMPRETFRERYKGAEEVNWDDSGYTKLETPWREDEEILVAEYWRREPKSVKILLLSDGTTLREDKYAETKDYHDAMGHTVIRSRKTIVHSVKHCLLTGAEILERNDWAGQYIPIVPVYGEDLNVEGKRYLRSLIRDAKDSQRNYNYWRTSSTEMVALAPKVPFIGPKGAFTSDHKRWATANTDSHAFIEYDGATPPKRQPFPSQPAAHLQEALNASDDMKSVVGLYDASLGARSNEISGRAIMARQREGDVSTFHFIDNLARAIRHAGRILIDLIPHVYTAPRMIRVIGADNDPPQVAMLAQRDPMSGAMPPPPQNAPPNLAGVFDLTAGKYDLVVEAGPSFTTRREEAAAQMIEFIRAYPQAAPFIGDLLAKNLDWPNADKLAQRLQSVVEMQMAGFDPAKVAELAKENQQLKTRLTQLQQDQTIDRGKLAVEGYEAETDRFKAVSDAMKPPPAPRIPQ